ncbi:hypothetical protein Cob_v007468 [Colletotrichum orbiculare MAFF 240422]|uniref:Uncharacterized protein n=1 Tax=Colletotrichum orbiculare (strain 104-T / ATCC 96160 / CBS 514.97 / LARS 414 / MAFF 240422) TaxID=1213857 RepID=A0A484FP46_COLOR|nr:hypothetical protein Cob_v007468 [Colletotrichum orbiculare MAFF 240422]
MSGVECCVDPVAWQYTPEAQVWSLVQNNLQLHAVKPVIRGIGQHLLHQRQSRSDRKTTIIFLSRRIPDTWVTPELLVSSFPSSP